MKKVSTVLLMFTSISAFADNSIVLKMTDATGFGIDTYSIPSIDGETADQSLMVLANVLPRDACYTGKAIMVKTALDAVIASAENVKNYSSFVSKNKLSVDLTVYNKNIRSKQRNQLVIEQCNLE